MGIFFQNFLSIDRFLLNKYILQMLSSRATIRVVLPMRSLPRNSVVKTKFASAKNENNKIIEVNDNRAVTKWQALCQALYLHYIIWILTIILEVGFDNFPILHTGRPFKRWVTHLRKWQSRFKLRSYSKTQTPVNFYCILSKTKNGNLWGGSGKRLAVTLAAKSQGKAIGVEEKIMRTNWNCKRMVLLYRKMPQ